MAGSSTEGFDRIRRVLARLVEAAGQPLLRTVAEVAREQTDRRFDTKRDPQGQPWKLWSQAYADTRPPGASLLIDSGALRKLIEERVGGVRVELIAQTPYSGAVQTKRPFFGVGPRDADELRARVEAHFVEALRAA